MSDFRIAVQVVDGQMAIHIGGPVTADLHTFEFSCPELAELWDRIKVKPRAGLDIHAVGVERLNPPVPCGDEW